MSIPCSIVVPTRDDPQRCVTLLEDLLSQLEAHPLELNVVFLVNDSSPDAAAVEAFEACVFAERFKALRPTLLRASDNHPTVEENIRWTLGFKLDSVAEYFLIVGNSDRVQLGALRDALRSCVETDSDLVLVGVINREIYGGMPMRQLYATPRYPHGDNRLRGQVESGPDVFHRAMLDYGPVDYLAFIGCQLYRKSFFVSMTGIQDRLYEPLYSLPMATLATAASGAFRVLYFPAPVVVRIDVLLAGPDRGEHPSTWWIPRARIGRGRSWFPMMPIVSNMIDLDDESFSCVARARTVAVLRGHPVYLFDSFLGRLVGHGGPTLAQDNAPELRLAPEERLHFATFADRLRALNICGDPGESSLVCDWLHAISGLTERDDQLRRELASLSAMILSILDRRVGFERWSMRLVSAQFATGS
jgi:hypothetical protein